MALAGWWAAFTPLFVVSHLIAATTNVHSLHPIQWPIRGIAELIKAYATLTGPLNNADSAARLSTLFAQARRVRGSIFSLASGPG